MQKCIRSFQIIFGGKTLHKTEFFFFFLFFILVICFCFFFFFECNNNVDNMIACHSIHHPLSSSSYETKKKIKKIWKILKFKYEIKKKTFFKALQCKQQSSNCFNAKFQYAEESKVFFFVVFFCFPLHQPKKQTNSSFYYMDLHGFSEA